MKTEKTFTPGPWTVEVNGGYITGHIISEKHTYAGNTVSRKDSICDPNSMTYCDAHLIATAPDLLDFAIAYQNKIREGLTQYDINVLNEMAQTAIAKALNHA